MQKTFKKSVSILLAVIMILSVFTIVPMSAGATNPAASVNGTTYETFEEAVAARANVTDVITLLADYSGTYVMDLGTLKVKNNGFTFAKPTVEGAYIVSQVVDDGVSTYTTTAATVKHTNPAGTVVTYYTEANLNVLNNGTYQLLADVTSTLRMTYGSWASNVTLDLNGYTLTSSASDYAINLPRAGSASSPKVFALVDTSTNGGGKLVFTTNPTTSTAAIRASAKYNNITIGEGVTVDGGAVALLSANQSLTVNGTINGGDDFAIVTNGASSKDATITINDGAVVTSDDIAMYLPAPGICTINGGTITGDTAIYIKTGTLNINGGTITGTGDQADYSYNGNGANATGDAIVVDNCNYGGNGAPTVTISGGIFESAKADAIGAYDQEETTDPTIAVSGGTFDRAVPAEYCANGFVPADDGSGNYGVEKAKAVQAYDGEGTLIGTYTTINDAIEAGGDGCTVKLIADLYEQQQINSQMTPVTFDLNGHVIHVNGGAGLNFSMGYYWNGDHIFTITDTVGGGGIDITPRYPGNACISDNTGRTIIVQGGTFTSTGKAVYCTAANATFTINGGTFEGEVYVHDTGYGHGELAITNGSFSGTVSATGDAVIAISGGTFDRAVPEEFCADGYIPEDNGNGTYGVGGPYAAKIGTVGYDTLAEAITAAQDGDTITVLADTTVPCYTTQITGKAITIDATGYTVTGTGYTTFPMFNVKSTGGLTLTGGTFSNPGGIISNSGTTVVNGATLTAEGFAIQNKGDLTISSGTITATESAVTNGATTAVTTITGGNFTGKIKMSNVGDGSIAISGGTFDRAVPEEFCALGFVPENNGDGSYGVKPDGNLALHHSISLNGDVALNFYLNPALVDVGDTINFTWTVNGAGKSDSYDVTAADLDPLNGYKVSVSLPAAEMTSTVRATVNNSDVYDDYSVRAYCDVILANPDSSPELVDLVKTMLNYGAYAQRVWGINETSMADEGIEYEMNYELTNETIDNAIKAANNGFACNLGYLTNEFASRFYTTSLSFLSKCTLRHYFFNPADRNDEQWAGSVDDYFYYVEKTNIAAADLDKLYDFTVDGVTFQYSALDYVKEVINNDRMDVNAKNLAKATYWYNQAANAFFG